jgi:hypothetical protein
MFRSFPDAKLRRELLHTLRRALLECRRHFAFGTFAWQSVQAMLWMSWRLALARAVVSMRVTSRPQCDEAGWHWAQAARVSSECVPWQSRQLMPSWTPRNVRSSLVPAWCAALGA